MLGKRGDIVNALKLLVKTAAEEIKMACEYSAKDVMVAIRSGDVSEVEKILSGDDKLLHLITPLGSWLHIATEQGQDKIVELLVNLGIDVNIKGGPSGVTPLNTAAYEGHLDLLTYFLERNAVMDISEPDRNPLFAAIHAGHKNIVELLLKAGIDTTVKYTGKSMKDMDAIAFAYEWGRKEIAEMIKEHNRHA
ncbi:ankyrin repeat domain-containing protein [Vibrio diabolicus]|uniref:ankyrin repeat domain-containing protein n=1 Tax=Vibrio diabolicus TaxID=50719 RepID=UPI002659D341|nr:ankyrin repeat domain-containing protein [Vibrio alginolyticus]